jgi:hypothetical protein
LSYRNVSANKFFYQNDKMRDRKLTFSEFFEAVQRLDSQIEVIEADILFIHFDKDSNFSITLDEFTEQLSEESYLNEYSHLLNMHLRGHNYSIGELVGLYSEQRKKNSDGRRDEDFYDVRRDRIDSYDQDREDSRR